MDTTADAPEARPTAAEQARAAYQNFVASAVRWNELAKRAKRQRFAKSTLSYPGREGA
jgi:hypothetical protein